MAKNDQKMGENDLFLLKNSKKVSKNGLF